MTAAAKILVAGIGNELFGDDGFGVAVIARLAERSGIAPLTPGSRRSGGDGVTLMNAGTRGFDLVSTLVDGYTSAILIDAAPRGGAPGTLYVLEPASATAADLETQGLDTWIDPHRLDPVRALLLARSLNAPLERILIVGCEPTPELEMRCELSAPVLAAVEPALDEVERLIAELSSGERAPDDARLEAAHA